MPIHILFGESVIENTNRKTTLNDENSKKYENCSDDELTEQEKQI